MIWLGDMCTKPVIFWSTKIWFNTAAQTGALLKVILYKETSILLEIFGRINIWQCSICIYAVSVCMNC